MSLRDLRMTLLNPWESELDSREIVQEAVKMFSSMLVALLDLRSFHVVVINGSRLMDCLIKFGHI